MSVTAGVRRRRRRTSTAASAILAILALVLTVAAVRYPGLSSSEVEVTNGGVWITNAKDGLLGRLNVDAGELDARLAMVGDDLDIVQSGYTVFETSARGFTPINSAAGTRLPSIETFPGSQFALGGDRVAVTAPDGRVWVLTPEQAAGFDPTQGAPTFAARGKQPVVTVTASGTVLVLDGSTLTPYPRDPDGKDPKPGAPIELGGVATKPESVQMTAVGDVPVVLDRENRLLRIGEKGRAVDLSGEGITDLSAAVLQMPSEHADSVLLATADALLEIPLDGGKPTAYAAGGTGTPAAPARAQGCAFAAWSGSLRYARICAGHEPSIAAVPDAAPDAVLVLRQNRDLVVLNDQKMGLAWRIADEMQLVDQWAIQQEIKSDTSKTLTKETLTSTIENAVKDRRKENRPPVANDDRYGVRAGQNVVLPVTMNDTDPDGDVLTVSVAGKQPSIGTVSAIRGGTQLQVAVAPDATGTAQVDYRADDGRGGTATATIVLDVHPASTNAPPRPAEQTMTKVRVRSGQTTSLNILPYWEDPDGDPFYLADATMQPEDVVSFTPDGLLTINDAGLATGTKQVRLTLRDEHGASAEGTLEVEAVTDDDLPPITTADHLQVTAGSRSSVRPLINDINPSGGRLELTHVGTSSGLEVEPDLQTGTVTVSAQTPGTHYLEYTAAAGAASAQGLIRIDVTAPESQDRVPIAVDDLGMVTTGSSLLLDPLENDVDPTGGVLVVNSVTGVDGTGLKATVLGHHLLRIEAAPNAKVGDEPISLTYEVANSAGSAQGRIRVMIARSDTQFANPVAASDEVVVRAGDLVDADVLANDISPAHSQLRVSRLLDTAEAEALGHAEVHRDRIRFTAKPGSAGQTHLTYEVADETGRTGSARLRIRVVAEDAPNQQPRPANLVARTVSGAPVRIPISPTGIDPDGDSVMLMGVASPAPHLGEVTDATGEWIEYTPHEGAIGTDRFRYQVVDRGGAVGTAEVLVGIARPANLNQPPFAVDDVIEVRPDRVVQIPVLDNDSDPEGDELSMPTSGIEATTAIQVLEDAASTAPTMLTVRTPREPGTHTIVYEASDGQLSSPALATVRVDPNAQLRAPIATDDYVAAADVLDPKNSTIDVAVLANDRDPDGATDQLEVALAPTADATLRGKGVVRVNIGDQQQRIRYTITDIDGLSSAGYIWVPGRAKQVPVWVGDTVTVRDGATTEIDLASPRNVRVRPGGQTVRITDPDTATAAHADGSELVADASTLRYRPQDGFSGQDSISVEVSDGANGDAAAAVTTLSIPIEVLPADGNAAPQMRGAAMEVELGGAQSVLDLNTSATDPDGDALTFAMNPVQAPTGVSITVEGGSLRASADTRATKGAVVQVPITVTDGQHDPVEATFQVTVTGSKRPRAAAVRDEREMKAGETVTIPVLANDSNPFAGKPLTVRSAALVAGKGTVTVQGDQVAVTADPDFAGVLTGSYAIRDATGDPAREAVGEIRVVVLGKPAAPHAPRISATGDGTVDLNITAGDDNGSPITGYTVSSANGGGISQDCPSTACTITGLRNGTEYTFTVVARNAVGVSPASPASAPAQPDVRPDAPDAPSVQRGDGALTVSWAKPANRGSAIQKYTVQLQDAQGGAMQERTVEAGTTSTTWNGLTNGQDYRFRVRAQNLAPDPSDWSDWSRAEHPAGKPQRPDSPPKAARVNDPLGGAINVSWPAHSSKQANGEPVTSYVVNVSDGSTRTVDGSTTSMKVRGLDPNGSYTFTVVAVNSIGSSAPGPASKKVTPFAVPTAPGNVRASVPPKGADGAVQLHWSAADGRGTPVTHYVITWPGGERQIGAERTDVVITGLKNGTSYTFGVQARNSHEGGESEIARSNPYTPFTAPSAPTMSARPYTCPSDGSRCPVTYDVALSNTGGGTDAKIQYRVTRQDGSTGGWGTLPPGADGRASFSMPNWPYDETITVDTRVTTTTPDGKSTLESPVTTQKIVLRKGASGP